MSYLTSQTASPMSQSLYKSTLNFLKKHSELPVTGNHLRRLQILSSRISSCIRTGKSSYEGLSISECVSKKATDKAIETRITQTKRWLSSKWTDWESFFAPYMRLILGQLVHRGELILIMDGSETARGCVTLMLSVLWRGYAIPLVWITKEGKKGHFKETTHIKLLELAQSILPSVSEHPYRVVVLGDGEFDGEQLRAACKEAKWEFVLRTAIDRQIDCGNGEMARIDTLEPFEGEEIVFVLKACQGDNAVWWHAKGFDDPIPLLTNMDLGAMACAYYKKRFKIETLFKQLKSQGFNIHMSKIQDAQRVANLIIIVAFAFIFSTCAGLMIKLLKKEQLKLFLRCDRAAKMLPITIVHKCLKHQYKLAIVIFSNLSNNLIVFFSNDT